jgi:L-lactate dehydrogenase complex protein LldE
MTQHPRVALFVTCLVDQIVPDVGVAAVRLLRRAGYQVDFPEAQTCCGQPFYNGGFREEARRLARRFVEIFEPYDVVVAPSGSCISMIRTEYPHLLAGEAQWQERARSLAARTYELSEFLVHQAGWRPAPNRPAPTVTYHDSCHMKRLLQVHEEPRALLVAAGCKLVEMPEADRCCGFGGIFSVHMPEVSNAMTVEKLRQATGTEGHLLITSDPGCLVHMRGLVDDQIPVEHLATLLETLTR